MNPYALKSVHTWNLDTYMLALAAAADEEVAVLVRLIEMELALVAEADDLILQIQRLRAEQRACAADHAVTVRWPSFCRQALRGV